MCYDVRYFMLLACKIKIVGNFLEYKWFDLIKF